MRSPTVIAVFSALFASSATAQVYSDEIPSVVGRSSSLAAPVYFSSASPVATAAGSSIDPLSAIINSIIASATSTMMASSSATSTTSASTSMTSMSTSATGSSTTSTYSIPFGSTLSNGAYVCNPAHSYAPNLSCDGSNATPTLVTLSVTYTGAAASTTSASAIISLPTTMYMGSTGVATGWVATWTGGAMANAIPVAGALVAGVVGLIA